MNRTTLSGLPAYELIASGTFDFKGLQQKFGKYNMDLVEQSLGKKLPPIGDLIRMKYTSVLALKDGLGYVVSYALNPLPHLFSMSDPEDSYYEYLPTVKKMINSFEILK